MSVNLTMATRSLMKKVVRCSNGHAAFEDEAEAIAPDPLVGSEPPPATRNRGAAAGTAGTRGGAVRAKFSVITTFADAVPSAPHVGHWIGPGILPFTGSTSNLNFEPQAQTTLISIIGGEIGFVPSGAILW